MARLGDFFTITSGGTPDKRQPLYYDGGTIPWVKTGDLKDKYISEKIACITKEGLEHSSAKLFPCNTVLVAMYGATIGACSILLFEASTNQACAAFLPNKDVLPSYLYYFLCSRKEQFIKDGVGGAQPNISARYLKNVSFTMRSMNEQLRITTVLDKINDLIALRKQQLEKLDELVKVRFVEMFGDPVFNPIKWPLVPLLEMGKCKNGMNFHNGDSGIEMHCLGVGDFKDLSAIHDTSKLSKVLLNEMPNNDYLLKNEDIVFVRSNGNKALVGRCLAVYPGNILTTFSGFCIRYRRHSEKTNTEYLLQVLKSDSMRKKMAGRGANIQNLNQKILASLDIPVPPRELQHQFVLFVNQIEKCKLTIQRGLDKLEMMKKALMQEYFG